ncbi:MAG: type II CAAX prenyl endopeptidase Rce1 family protein [Byssovorax cruenta]
MKWIAPVFVYVAVGVGLFIFRTAWSSLLTFHIAILISLLIARPNIPLRILFTGRNIQWILISILLCGSSGVTLYFFWDKFGIANDLAAHVEAMGLSASTWIPFITYFTLVNPLLEEYFWRGYLGSPTTNFYLSDFLYAGFHGLILLNKVQPSMIVYSLALLVLAGWFWRQIARTDGGLLAPVLGHMAADLTILLAVYLRLHG